MSKIIGIDLGTTNSCVAVMEGGEPVVIPNAEGSRTTPSVVGFNKDGERLVGRVAKNQAIQYPDRTVASIKRKMGTNEKVTIDGKQYTPQEISAMILQKLKADAESYLGETVSQAVITAAGLGGLISQSFSAARSSRDPAIPGERNMTGSAPRDLIVSVNPLWRKSLQYWREVVGTNPYARCAPSDARNLAPTRPICSSSLRVKAIPCCRVERIGPGSPMNETGIFESRTRAAVSSGPGSLATMPSSPTAHSARNASGVNSAGIWNRRVCQLGCIRVK